VLRPSPRLARPIDVPRALHLHVRVQRAAVVERHQQMLAARLDVDDARSGSGRADAAGITAQLEPDDFVTVQCSPQTSSRRVNVVALGQRRLRGRFGARSRPVAARLLEAGRVLLQLRLEVTDL